MLALECSLTPRRLGSLSCALFTLLSLLSQSCASGGGNGKGSAGSAGDPFGSAAIGGGVSGSSAGSSGSSEIYTDSGITGIRCAHACQDFPAAPIIDDKGSAPPSNVGSLFGKASNFNTPGACVLEPQLSEGDDKPGALFPSNWLRPRFRFTAANDDNVWEVRLHNPLEAHDLVAYTTNTTWSIPRAVWKAMALTLIDTPITVTIRGLNKDHPGKPSGTQGTFTIAPAEARGKLVYWATTSSEVKPDASKLVGFDVGDESVIDALTIPQVGQRNILAAGGRDLRGKNDDPKGVAPGAVECIGCHVSTPDGEAVAFTDHWPWDNVLASVQAATVGQRPSYLTPGAEMLLNQPWLGMQTFSKSHFAKGDRVVVTVYSPRHPNNQDVGYTDSAPYPSHADRLAWIDLESPATFTTDQTKGDVEQQLNDQIAAEVGKSWGMIAMNGETRSVAAPSFNHDGTRIVYTSADNTQDGRISGNNQEVDLHIVPYANRQGGDVMPLQGAAEPHVAEYYPSFSADDKLVAFNRVGTIDGAPIYYRSDGEVYVVPSDGGTATRLAANDPPSCGGQKSPGILNSWAKWSPSVSVVAPQNDEFQGGARTYYWLVFSSARAYDGQFQIPNSPGDAHASQLYVTAIVRHEDTGKLETFPAIYLWNQGAATSNLTPAWDEFKIPPVPGPD